MSQRRSSFSKAAAVAGCALLLLGAHSATQSSDGSTAPRQSDPKGVSASRGELLFHGGEPLIGRLRDHAEPLPSEVVTCNHCHATSQAKPVPGSDAPVLDRVTLTQFKVRRNSPQSRYDVQSFCKIMRTDVDPVFVLVAKQMPVYAIDDNQCASLWLFLTTESEPTPKPAPRR